MTHEPAGENFAMGLPIVEKDGRKAGLARRSRPMLAVRFHARKAADVEKLLTTEKASGTQKLAKQVSETSCSKNKILGDSSTKIFVMVVALMDETA